MKKYYVAYGSNLNLAQMAVRCPDANVVGKSFLEDYRLMYKGTMTGAYLTVEKEEGACLPIGIWEVQESDEASLDVYEGYPDLYYKQNLEVKLDDGRKVDAFVYIMHEDRSFGMPSDEYVEVCTVGYRDFGFDEKYLEEALSYSKKQIG